MRRRLITGVLTIFGSATAQLCESVKSSASFASDPPVQSNSGAIFFPKSDFATNFDLSPVIPTYVDLLQKRLIAKGTQLVIVRVPPRGLTVPKNQIPSSIASYDTSKVNSSFRASLAALREKGVLVPDLSVSLTSPDHYMQRDPHWTPSGAKAAAQAVAKVIKAHPQAKSLKNSSYVTKPGSSQQYISPLEGAINANCPIKVTPQQFTTQITEPLNNEDGLLNEDLPQIVLAGTSLSRNSLFNFDGALKQELGADVLNVSEVGGGPDTAIVNYLKSKEFQINPPKFLIWESAAWHYINDLSIFRQLLAEVDSECKNGKFLPNKSFSFGSSTSFDLLDKPISNITANSAMYVKFSDRSVNELTVNITYADNVVDRSIIRRSDRVVSDGKFFYSVFTTPQKIIKQINISTPKSYQGTISSAICYKG